MVWVDGQRGLVGVPTASNAQYGDISSFLGCGGTSDLEVTALTNGNYVVLRCSQTVMGVTKNGTVNWADGTNGGKTGHVLSDSILAGLNEGTQPIGIIPLSNGSYVVASGSGYLGSIGTAPGGVTWGAGDRPIGSVPLAGGTTVVSASNSLVGATVNMYFPYYVQPLANGNWAVLSINSPEGVAGYGGVTWGSGQGASLGTADRSNTVVGDDVSLFAADIAAPPDGRLVAMWSTDNCSRSDLTNCRRIVCEYDGAGPISGGPADAYCFRSQDLKISYAAAPSGQVWAALGAKLHLFPGDGIFANGFDR